jgi:hypothetical protein
MGGRLGAAYLQVIHLSESELENRVSVSSTFMNAPRIKLLAVVLLLLGTVSAEAKDPTENELVPLIKQLIDAPFGLDGTFGPQVLPGLHRNFVKVKVLEIKDAETTDASAKNTLRGIPEGRKVWPVRSYIIVSFNDPSNKETLKEEEATCYVHLGDDGKWVVSAFRPTFKKSILKKLLE